MKRSQLKLFAIILFIVQTGVAFYSLLVTRNLLGNFNLKDILSSDQLIIFLAFIVNLFISIALLIFIFRLYNIVQMDDEVLEQKDMEITKREKRRLDKKQLEIEKEELARKNLILEKLNADIEKIEKVDLFTEKVLINISKVYDIMQGIFFVKDLKDKVFRKAGAYAYFSEEELREFTEEVGLSGQVAANRKLLNITNIPDKYITVLSGLGKSSPANLLIFPVLHNNESIGVIELASFVKFDSFAEKILMEFSVKLGEGLSKFITENEPAS